MTKIHHEIEKLVILRLLHHPVAIVHQDPRSEMRYVGELGNGHLNHELALQVPHEVQLADEGDLLQVPNLVHEVLPLEYLCYHPQSRINSVDDHTFSSAIAISLYERFPLEISDFVSRNTIHRYFFQKDVVNSRYTMTAMDFISHSTIIKMREIVTPPTVTGNHSLMATVYE